MNLLYITFGSRIDVHYQAHFSMLSFLAQRGQVESITVITDAPAFYKHLSTHITVREVDAATLKDWRGPHDFFWRIKIKAIAELAQTLGEKPILYLDTDTFLFGQAADLKQTLTSRAVMHEREGALPNLATKTERRMWQQIRHKTFGGIVVGEQHSMWNAGVVGLPAHGNAAAIATALAMCDDMCAQGVERRLIEQLALAIALDEAYTLAPADSWIGHYWGNKPAWNDAISQFFLDHLLHGHDVEEEIAAIGRFDFRRLPMRIRRSSMHARWLRLADKLYPFKDVVHLKP